MQTEKLLIGRREKIDFPIFKLTKIIAKVDTGAYTTALHCDEILEKNGVLYFTPLGLLDEGYTGEQHTATDYVQKEIRNSFGEIEKRYIIKTTIKIGPKRINAQISLTNRGKMRYPVLIGRKLLKNRFIVDVALLETLTQNVTRTKK